MGSRLIQGGELAEDVLTSPATVTTAGTAVRVASTVVAGAMIAVFLAVYFAIRRGYYRNGLITLFPPARWPRIAKVLERIGVTLWWWTLGRLAGMFVIGLTSAIGLLLIGIPLVIELGVLVGLLAFIPNFGLVLSVVPPFYSASSKGWEPLFRSVVLLYIGLQCLEGYLLTPLIEQHQVLLPPGPIQVMFALLFGFLGVFLATPLTVEEVHSHSRAVREGTLLAPVDPHQQQERRQPDARGATVSPCGTDGGVWEATASLEFGTLPPLSRRGSILAPPLRPALPPATDLPQKLYRDPPATPRCVTAERGAEQFELPSPTPEMGRPLKQEMDHDVEQEFFPVRSPSYAGGGGRLAAIGERAG